VVLVSLLVLGSPLAHAAAAGEGNGFKSGVFDPPRTAPDFVLQGSSGSPVSLSQYRGKVVAMAFGFTHCPTVCPVTFANLARVYEQLGPAAKDVQVVFITVDPDRDTPPRLHEFLTFFNPAFVGATGTPAQLEAVRQAYGVTTERVPAQGDGLGYQIHHSSSLFLIDRGGQLRLLTPFGKSSDDILHDIKLLLKT
jgi:protein SCO1/2